MEQHHTQAQAIITMIIALMSCLASFYLWIVLFLRKREYQRTRRDTYQTTAASTYGGGGGGNKYIPTTHKFSYTTYYNITIYTQFVYYMAMYQTILSLTLMIQSVNEVKKFTDTNSNCSWTSDLKNIFCFLWRSIISYFLIGSISWYFMITITICSSLFNRVSISNINKITKYHLIVISISLFVSLMELYISHRTNDYDFTHITTILPTIITESIYICVCFMATIYIKCCYPFYFVGEDRFRMILYLIVFVSLWLFPSLYNMFPSEMRINSDIYFAKQICINSTGLATMIIWRFLSVFPNHPLSTSAHSRKYRSVDDNDETPIISDGQSSVSAHTISYPMNKNGFPVTRRDINSYSPKKSTTSTSDIDDNINENIHIRNRSYDSSMLWFVRSTPNSSKSSAIRGHKKNMSSNTTLASSTITNMMPALPNDSPSEASNSSMSSIGGHRNMEYGILPEQVTETNLDDTRSKTENNLCLSLSQNLIVKHKKSSTSSYLKAKNKIFGASIANFFRRKKARIGESYNKDSLMAAAESNFNENDNDERGSIRINRNIASENQYGYYVHSQSGMIPPTDSMQKTPYFKTIKLPNGQYQKIICDPNDKDAVLFKYSQNNNVNIYDSDYDEELEHNNTDGSGNRKDTFEDIEKGHVWQRTP